MGQPQRKQTLARYLGVIILLLGGLIGLSVGIGFSGILIALGTVVALFDDWRSLLDWSFAMVVSQFVIEGLAMWLWLVRRSWIRRRSRGQRRALVTAA